MHYDLVDSEYLEMRTRHLNTFVRSPIWHNRGTIRFQRAQNQNAEIDLMIKARGVLLFLICANQKIVLLNVFPRRRSGSLKQHRDTNQKNMLDILWCPNSLIDLVYGMGQESGPKGPTVMKV